MMHAILKPSFVRKDERGTFTEVFNEGNWQTLLTGTMTPGAVMGNHYHKETDVYFYVMAGAVEIKTLDVFSGAREVFELHSGEGVILPMNESHAVHFVQDTSFLMMKSKHYDPASPDTFEMQVE